MKKFNVAGVCIPQKHYMVNIDNKLQKIITLIENEDYFTINRSRQYGKSTTFIQLYKSLKEKYIIINTSFEGIGDDIFGSEFEFCSKIVKIFARELSYDYPDASKRLDSLSDDVSNIDDLSVAITNFIKGEEKEVLLAIDEVDKSCNNQLFLSFLGMLRNKYLRRQRENTFKSVILAGVYDIKNLKFKLGTDEEKKYNSPWNIAADFDVDMSFNSSEIATMLVEYENHHKTCMDIDKLSHEIYKYSTGYPFLVSKICKTIDEKLNKNWCLKGVEEAVKILLDEKNTLFDDLIKNIENYKEIYSSVYSIVVEGKRIMYNADAYEKELMFSILARSDENILKVHNKIFELRIYNYMIAKRGKEQGEVLTYEYRAGFVENGKLNMTLVLDKFQELMCSEYRDRDSKFIEREGRLLFLCFLKPIINGKGFYYVESETRMDNRMDVIVTFGDEQFIIELKIWHGANYEKDALEQLSGYLSSKMEKTGYLVSFNFNKNKEYSKKWNKHKGKDIYSVVV